MASTARPDKILKDLSELWVSLGAEQQNGESVVLRACAMTLIVVGEECDDPQTLGESLAELMKQVPSRAIVLRLRDAAGPVLESRVLAQCWMPLGRRQQICCEQIEIIVSAEGFADLEPFLLPLVAPDLPVVLWARCARVIDLPSIDRLMQLAGTVVMDSAMLGAAPLSLQRIAQLKGTVRRVADLAWTRLTGWRETIAQVFDNPHYRDRLDDIVEVEVRRPEGDRSVEARYLAAWLAAGLPRAQVSITSGAPALVRLTGGSIDVSLSDAGNGSLELKANSSITHVLVPPRQDAALLAEELSILGHDPQFEAALSRAVR